ncbi:1-deoxy-D-xylulose-5-phosphate synthase [Rubrivirga sp. SAORIC476]|uniref:1-deoxy-D-xylulose-5-phosphate synthase n=1 Tax=Rubrivirga sp. SAORIC476 TaxID=1961794 RepID=UPI000BA90345|nr:1-deoxy-D-xylulose-5-phosphate synthase [Rubrivirga sp. SAORIC476]PAP79607.1 1-deoxy-D-xylulose-5-phosphate synthase [Rubrivirga sp. SAORIC476]
MPPVAPTLTPGPLLASIDSPADLRALPAERLPQLCDELREYIVDIVSVHGGHFGASLGVVELTVALHWAYATPEDQLVWDVGHQAYGHKILTGRRDVFPTNRTYGGLSGFPKRDESEYDTFGVGHASTSISAALGMATASKLTGNDRKVVAVIGDGSMTGGLAFEGLNNAGASDADLLVVLNDNRISIDPNVGALHEYLAKVSSSGSWNALKGEVWELFDKMKGLGGGHLQRLASRVEDGLKAVLTPGMLFEALGFRYIGPVDGHDVVSLATQLKKLRGLPGPILLHTLTVKGKGFAPAEADQVKWHAQSSPFDKLTGKSLAAPTAAGTKPPKWQDVFGDAVIELAEADERVVGVTAAMPSGTSLGKMMAQMPDRAFDVGIAEMHAVVFAAGLATQGMRPFAAIYSTFMQRAYDGVVHDVALQNLPVVFCMDRAGVAGADGPTHHGALDVAYMRAVQGLVCAAPLHEQDLRDLLYTALQYDGPFAVRYPRGAATGMPLREGFEPIEIGTGRKVRDGTDVAFVTYGAIGQYAIEACDRLAAEGVDAAHYDLRFVKPLDAALLTEVFGRHSRVITVEDGVRDGGAGSAVLEWASDAGVLDATQVVRLGLPDRFVEHGTQRQLHDEVGIGPDGLVRAARALVGAEAEAA